MAVPCGSAATAVPKRISTSFFADPGLKKSARIELAVMDMWHPFRNSVGNNTPSAAIVFDKFHIMRHLSDALDQVRRDEYKRLQGTDRSYIKGQRYTLLSNRENLSLDGCKALKKLLAANKRLNTASPSAAPGRSSSAGSRACAGSGWRRTRSSCG